MQCVWRWNEQSKNVVGSKHTSGLMSVIFVEYSVTLSYVMILQLSNLRVTHENYSINIASSTSFTSSVISY
jgi:hypothetical protein